MERKRQGQRSPMLAADERHDLRRDYTILVGTIGRVYREAWLGTNRRRSPSMLRDQHRDDLTTPGPTHGHDFVPPLPSACDATALRIAHAQRHTVQCSEGIIYWDCKGSHPSPTVGCAKCLTTKIGDIRLFLAQYDAFLVRLRRTAHTLEN